MVKVTEDGLVLTLASDDEGPVVEPDDDDDEDKPAEDEAVLAIAGADGTTLAKKKANRKRKRENSKAKDAVEMDPTFTFAGEDDGFGSASWDFREALVKLGLKPAGGPAANGRATRVGDNEEDEEDEAEDDGLADDALKAVTSEEAGSKLAKRKARRERKAKKTGSAVANGDDVEEQEDDDEPQVLDTDRDPKAKEFFEELGDELRIRAGDGSTVLFSQLNLSRPLLRAVEAMGYVTPTPIQTAVIPVVLAGKDVCGSAVTGSGKTAAFCLPILERLLFRPKRVAATRVLIMSPTRELAVQTHLMLQKLSQFTDIVSCLVVGGSKNLRAQEAELRSRPDILVCTPGRMLDHLTNSHSIGLEDLEILVLDEVDQLVDLGFQAEVEQLVKECPRGRQTLLFSATMTAKVDALARLALNRPVRVRVDGSFEMAPRLEQEFVRVRKGGSDEHRHALLLALVSRTFKKRTLVFCNTKIDAHRTKLVLELSGISVAELHGNLNQAQRLESLGAFKEGQASVLVCTDLAARGLDVPGIQTVINADMPRTRTTYVHRVGRTARAGCGGRAVSLVSESARLLMKEIVADIDDKTSVKSRVLPPAVVQHYEAKVSALQSAVEARLAEEDAERQMGKAQMEADRAQNMIDHRDEIMNRPARTWFQNEGEKAAVRAQAVDGAKGAAAAVKGNAKAVEKESAAKKIKKPHRLTRKKRRRMEALNAMQSEQMGGGGEDGGDDGGNDGDDRRPKKKQKAAPVVSQKAAAREAKRASQPKRLSADGEKAAGSTGKRPRAAGVLQVSGFDEDLGYGKTEGKKSKSANPNTFGFRQPPANTLRKGGKPSKHSFKSKAKHKRR